MDESLVQNCIFCGETISDYRNTMYRIGEPPPRGFSEGEIFVSEDGGLFLTALDDRYEFKKCQ